MPGLLLACIPVRRARNKALAAAELRWRYLTRVLILLAVTIALTAIAVSLSRNHPNTPLYPLLACAPGLCLALLRLALEARYLKETFINHVR
ncbi:hypothetical protein [Kribbella pratensis]|uniref:hypothetical protein n=1 Tax=Kribbella pratensis TaxID=2512112 RepID=UPI001064E7D7|nr:hypothetical protein [Kribbella pratensis]